MAVFAGLPTWIGWRKVGGRFAVGRHGCYGWKVSAGIRDRTRPRTIPVPVQSNISDERPIHPLPTRPLSVSSMSPHNALQQLTRFGHHEAETVDVGKDLQ